MANPKKRVPENVPGDFFVDSTCIDCDACRQIAPTVFGEAPYRPRSSRLSRNRAATEDTRCKRCWLARPVPSAASATMT